MLGPAAAVATAGVFPGITTCGRSCGWCARVKLFVDQCFLPFCCQVRRSASCIIAGKVSHSAVAAIRCAELVGICQEHPTSLAIPTRGALGSGLRWTRIRLRRWQIKLGAGQLWTVQASNSYKWCQAFVPGSLETKVIYCSQRSLRWRAIGQQMLLTTSMPGPSRTLVVHLAGELVGRWRKTHSRLSDFA